MYYSINNKKIYISHSEIRMNHKDISLPATLTDGFLASFGYEVVFDTPKPDCGELEIAYQDGTEIDSKGNRVIKWSIKDMFEDTPEKTKAEQEAEYLEAKRKALVPTQITPRQLRLQLLSVGLLDEVEALCANDRAMSIWFEYSLDFQRNHEMIVAMGTHLGMNETDMDTFFIEASKL